MKFNTFRITIKADVRIVGGIPIVPEGADRADAYEAWARGQGVEAADASDLAANLAEEADMPISVEDVAGLETGFRRDEYGIYIEARQVKAMLRESAQRLGIIKKVRGSRQVLQHDLHVRSVTGNQKLRLSTENGELISEPSGKDQRPISVVTRQGPRTAIKRFDYVTEPTIVFDVLLLAGGVGEGLIDQEKLADMVEFGGMLGLGADRSQGEGTFTPISMEVIES